MYSGVTELAAVVGGMVAVLLPVVSAFLFMLVLRSLNSERSIGYQWFEAGWIGLLFLNLLRVSVFPRQQIFAGGVSSVDTRLFFFYGITLVVLFFAAFRISRILAPDISRRMLILESLAMACGILGYLGFSLYDLELLIGGLRF